ncbi:MAG: hypothetical protein Q9170_006371 [Blastenia crenularia]
MKVGEERGFCDVRLCLAAELPSDFSYVTLSHCWGPEGLNFKLTRLSEPDFRHQIPWEPLPATFKHAIQFTRRLNAAFGIQYLWIDALCIIQDSEKDWFKEASNMADIYRYSFCNLASCIGPDSRFGLFWESDPYTTHTCIIEANIGSSESGFYKVKNYESYATAVADSMLETRAWVLQEVLLAPRVIYFTPQQWIWECSSICANQHAPTLQLIGSRGKSFKRHEIPMAQTIPIVEPNSSLVSDYELYRIWMNYVRAFTSRKLTKSRDKLIAISGLAKYTYARLTVKDRYIVGLWKRHLLLHMLWKVSYGQEASRPQPYRAPTWTWASVEGTIYNHRTNQEAVEHCSPIAEILKLDIKYTSDDEFCEVESAEAAMRGFLFEIFPEFQVRSTDQLATVAEVKWQDRILTVDGQNAANFDIKFSVDTKPSSLFCMPLVLEQYNNDNCTAACLLLESVPGKRGVYQRIGRCDLVADVQRMRSEAKLTELAQMQYKDSHGEATSSSSASSTIPTPSSSPSALPSSSTSSSNTTGAIAGGVVGGITAIVIAAAILFYFFRKSKDRSLSDGTHARHQSGGIYEKDTTNVPVTSEADSSGVYQLPPYRKREPTVELQ